MKKYSSGGRRSESCGLAIDTCRDGCWKKESSDEVGGSQDIFEMFRGQKTGRVGVGSVKLRKVRSSETSETREEEPAGCGDNRDRCNGDDGDDGDNGNNVQKRVTRMKRNTTATARDPSCSLLATKHRDGAKEE